MCLSSRPPDTHTTLKAPGASASWPDLCASEQVPLTSLEKLPKDGEGEKLVETAGRAGLEVISRHWGKKIVLFPKTQGLLPFAGWLRAWAGVGTQAARL